MLDAFVTKPYVKGKPMKKKPTSKPVPLGGVRKPSVPAKRTGGLGAKTQQRGVAKNPTKTKGWARGRKTV